MQNQGAFPKVGWKERRKIETEWASLLSGALPSAWTRLCLMGSLGKAVPQPHGHPIQNWRLHNPIFNCSVHISIWIHFLVILQGPTPRSTPCPLCSLALWLLPSLNCDLIQGTDQAFFFFSWHLQCLAKGLDDHNQLKMFLSTNEISWGYLCWRFLPWNIVRQHFLNVWPGKGPTKISMWLLFYMEEVVPLGEVLNYVTPQASLYHDSLTHGINTC